MSESFRARIDGRVGGGTGERGSTEIEGWGLMADEGEVRSSDLRAAGAKALAAVHADVIPAAT